MIVKATLLFHKCLQDMQDLGTGDEFMVSRVFFSVQLPEKRIDDLFVDLKQTVGDNYETGTIEVGRPQGKVGNLHYETFRDAVESYYRSLIGSSGRSVKVVKGSFRMRDNTLFGSMEKEITIDTEKGGW